MIEAVSRAPPWRHAVDMALELRFGIGRHAPKGAAFGSNCLASRGQSCACGQTRSASCQTNSRMFQELPAVGLIGFHEWPPEFSELDF
jgi:hypothetical protein